MKIATIIGARPQFIKAAAVFRVISEHNRLSLNGSHLTEIITHIGKGSIISAGSVLRRMSIEPYSIVAGNPGRIVGSRTSEN